MPLHWSLPADRRAVCFRLAPESRREAGPRWSHPVEPETLHPTPRYIALPALPPPDGAAARSSADGSGGSGDGGGDPAAAGGPVGGLEGAGGARRLRAVTTVLTAAAPAGELRGQQMLPARRMRQDSRYDHGTAPVHLSTKFVRSLGMFGDPASWVAT